MNRYQKNIVYAFTLGALLAMFIIVVEYQQPEYNENIVQSDFQLVTIEGKNIGWVFSTISLKYKPDRTLGRFYVTIKTEVSEPYWNHSIFSRDVLYHVSFWWNSMLLEQLEGNYFGALNPSRGRVMYSSVSLPSVDHPMYALRSVHSKIVLTIEGSFSNVTNNEIFTENKKTFHIFIIHPLARIVTLSLIIAVSGIAVVEKSGPTYKVKNIWEKIKKGKQ